MDTQHPRQLLSRYLIPDFFPAIKVLEMSNMFELQTLSADTQESPYFLLFGYNRY